MSCTICEEKYTKQTRKKVKCIDCKKSSCLTCFKTYSLSGNFKCMHEDCPKVYEFNEICSIANSKLFTNTLNNLISKQSLSSQKQHLSKYQEIKKLKDEQAIVSREIKEFYKEKKEIQMAIKEIRKEADRKINSLKNIISETLTILYQKRMKLEKQISIVQKEEYKSPVNNFTCSIVECGGILDENFVCTLCEKQMCKECHKHKDENHICNQEDVDTIKMIKENSRACPNCGEYISKINGCDQMYCDPKKNGTGCGTFFSYNTGLIDKNSRHNPHWYARSKAVVNGQLAQVENQECLDIFTHTDIRTWIQEIRIHTLDQETMYHFQSAWYFRYNLETKISYSIQKNKEMKIDAGIRYIKNKDEEKWFSQLKKINKSKNYYELRNKYLNLALVIVEDFIYTFIEKVKDKTISNRWIKDYVYHLDFIEQEFIFNFRSQAQHYNFRYNSYDDAKLLQLIHAHYRN